MPHPDPENSEQQLLHAPNAIETSDSMMPDDAVEEFDRLADQRAPGLLRQLFAFAMENKKWWLIPIIVVLLLVAVFIFISGTAGPFIYPLF